MLALLGDVPAQGTALEIALVRGLAAPHDAAAPLAVIRAAEHDPGCTACELDALLDEAELERAAGHADRARALLDHLRQRARAAHADDFVARATRLLAAR